MTMENFREELRYQYNLTPESVVLDCGGYEGRFAAGIYDRYGCTVHVLEPVKHFYDGIVLRFGADHPKVKVHNFGVGGENEEKRFSIKGDMTGAYADNPEVERVYIRDVNEIMEEMGPKFGLVKLNIEGGEFDVIDALIQWGRIMDIDNLQVQFHAVIPDAQMRFDRIQERLARTHSLTFDHGWVWQNWRRNE